jgi:hypothetical protein
MKWKTIRLELGPTAKLPRGSASRAFLLRVPIDDDYIDTQAVASNPTLATVRRFWGSERDESGRLEHVNDAWVFRPRDKESDGKTYIFAAGPFRLNAQLVVRQADGSELPFRVVSMKGLGGHAPPK